MSKKLLAKVKSILTRPKEISDYLPTDKPLWMVVGLSVFLIVTLFLAVILVQRQQLSLTGAIGESVFFAENGLKINRVLQLEMADESSLEVDVMMKPSRKSITGVDVVVEFDDYLLAEGFEPAPSFDTSIIPSDEGGEGIDNNNGPGEKRTLRFVVVNKGSKAAGGTNIKLGTLFFRPAKATPVNLTIDSPDLPRIQFRTTEFQSVATIPYNSALTTVDTSHFVKYLISGPVEPTSTPTIGPSPTPGPSATTTPEPSPTPACGGLKLEADFDGDCCIGRKDDRILINNWTNDKSSPDFNSRKRFETRVDLEHDGDVDADDREIFIRLYLAGPKCLQ